MTPSPYWPSVWVKHVGPHRVNAGEIVKGFVVAYRIRSNLRPLSSSVPIQEHSTFPSTISKQVWRVKKHVMPNILVTNVRSIVEKADKLECVLTNNNINIDIACITESWLTENIPTDAINKTGYVCYRTSWSRGWSSWRRCLVLRQHWSVLSNTGSTTRPWQWITMVAVPRDSNASTHVTRCHGDNWPRIDC